MDSIHVCPVCNAEHTTEGFQQHLSTHFKQQASGGLTPLYTVGTSPDKELVEGLCVEALSEAYKSLSVTAKDEYRKLTQEQSFITALHITIAHLTIVSECLAPLQNQILAPKHRIIKRLSKLWVQELSVHYNNCVTSPTSTNFQEAAHSLLSIISDFHTILKEDTSTMARNKILKRNEETTLISTVLFEEPS